MRSTACVAAVVLALGLGAWPAAQSPTPPSQTPAPATAPPGQQPARPPTFRTEANFVRVDAYPTKDGKPVLGLTANDFEIAEDGVPQKVEQFEHVVVRPAGPQADRIEPGSQREMLQAAENPRHRVFVLFLDTTHVRFEDSHAIAEPLIRLINRLLGPDDLVGVMTPDMSATELVLAQRTEVTEERLRTHWRWGSRFARMNDPREDAYEACYNPLVYGDLAAQMIARKREREALEAMQDVIRYLAGVREERKAILTVTNGWDLFTPAPDLLNRGGSVDVPSVDRIGVSPGGQLTTRDPRTRNDNNTLTKMECEGDRQRLSNIDDEQFLRDLINDANRSNASFYPIDPRGLVMFETGAGSAVPLAADQQMRRSRQESTRSLGEGTDGLTVANTNDLDKGLRRISDDLSWYYLLGYYSTNTRLDGGYRALKVRVTRPGVAVRARRGYRAASSEEVARSRAAAAAPAVDMATPIQAALEMLAAMRPDARVRLRATTSPGSESVLDCRRAVSRPGAAQRLGAGRDRRSPGHQWHGVRVVAGHAQAGRARLPDLGQAAAGRGAGHRRASPRLVARRRSGHGDPARHARSAAAVLPARPGHRQPAGGHRGSSLHARQSRAPRSAGRRRRQARGRPLARSDRAAHPGTGDGR